MVNKENYYQEYKMAKFDKQSLSQKNFFDMTLLHGHAQYIYIVCAKYQKASAKALVRVDFTVYALSNISKIPTGKTRNVSKVHGCPHLMPSVNNWPFSNLANS